MTRTSDIQLLSFHERYFERIWGGRKLRDVLGKEIPPGRPIGEAWLVSDLPAAQSVVVRGACAGRTLHDLLQDAPAHMLGRRAAPTPYGRFPLLLKLLDASDVLSVQVHPDDETAQRLAEQDTGKTEMWHVFQAEPGSEIICGLDPSVPPEDLAEALGSASFEDLLLRFEVEQGSSIFVPAGTVHALGAGILLAEIQQNSDLTYRLYDWGRLQPDGSPRRLHPDRALAAIHPDSSPMAKTKTLSYADGTARITVLAACRYFAAELVEVLSDPFTRNTRGDSFHILLGRTGEVRAQVADDECTVRPGECALVPGGFSAFRLRGDGAVIDYYVPDLKKDVVSTLLEHGHPLEDIIRLGGTPSKSDLRLMH